MNKTFKAMSLASLVAAASCSTPRPMTLTREAYEVPGNIFQPADDTIPFGSQTPPTYLVVEGKDSTTISCVYILNNDNTISLALGKSVRPNGGCERAPFSVRDSLTSEWVDAVDRYFSDYWNLAFMRDSAHHFGAKPDTQHIVPRFSFHYRKIN